MFTIAAAAAGDGAHSLTHGDFGLGIAVLAVGAMFSLYLIRVGLPEVIGWVLAGLGLSALMQYTDIPAIEAIRGGESDAWEFMGVFGAILLFGFIGLESQIAQLFSVGKNAVLVAVTGVVMPILGGYFVSEMFYGGEESYVYFFFGATFAATSVGITYNALKALKVEKTRAAQTIVAAAIFDDILAVIGLVIAINLSSGADLTTSLWLEPLIKSAVFLVAAVVLGAMFARALSWVFTKISRGMEMKLLFTLAFFGVGSWLASLLDIEYIIGAFAAGLVLDDVHFNDYDEDELIHALEDAKAHVDDSEVNAELDHVIEHRSGRGHVENLILGMSAFFVPVYFEQSLSGVDFETILNIGAIIVPVIVLTVVAGLAKVVSMVFAPGDVWEKLLVGVGMMARGEVGLVFAVAGRQADVFTDEQFAVLIMVVLLTTIISVVLINPIVKRLPAEDRGSVENPIIPVMD